MASSPVPLSGQRHSAIILHVSNHRLYCAATPQEFGNCSGNAAPGTANEDLYWLLLKLRGAAPRHSRWRTATFEALRRTFLKIAVCVRQLKSRISIALPTACPHRETLVLMLGRINAQSP